MSRLTPTQSTTGLSGTLTPEQAERVRTALRSAAGELELAVDQLEERIMPGLAATN